MLPSFSVPLLVFSSLFRLKICAGSTWDQPTEFTAEILKNGPLQSVHSVQRNAPGATILDASVVRFEPRSLHLKNQPTCMPRWEQVEITNIGTKQITIEAVSSEHNMFHPSISKVETLDPNEASKMQVLFLAQAVGHFEGLIFVQTNLGMVPFTVKATAVANPYMVEPILGAKVVVGERFSPPISVHNPHDRNLHVREVFTTEGFLHLALPDRLGESGSQSIERETEPSGESDASAGVWTVLPKQQKVVIHVSFVSHATGKFQGFVHLKTDADNLLVPVEIMVTKGGVHVTPEVVDFQTLVSPLQSRSMWLTLTNMNPQPIELLSLYDPKQDPNLQITGFDQKGINVMPGSNIRFAKVTYHGGEQGHMQGKLQLIINDTDSVSATLDIPYKARVLYGSLGFMNDKTKFQSTPGKVTSTMRSIMISNNFSVPILIHTAKIDDPSFQISHFVPNSLLMPRDAVSLMHVEFTSNGTSALYTRDLELSTNVTAMKIPLQVYHGRLHCQVEHGDLKECSSSDLDLDMGIISVTESRRKLINVTNLNPVNVTVESITFTHTTVNLYMEGVWGPKGEQVRGARPVPRYLQSKRILTLPPFHRLALAVEVVATDAGVTSAAITISTRRKEHIALRVRYESVLGSFSFLPATIRFEASFPGRVQSRIVAARSTFERPLHIHAVQSTDSRIIPELITTSLSPLTRTEIVRIHYDPSKFSSPEENYMPQSDEVEWDVPLTEEVVERWAKRQKMWDVLGNKGQTDIEATLRFDTNIVRGASLTVRAFLTKPSIVRESTLSFDLTQVGTSVTQMLLIHNPSDTILAVQLVFPLCDLLTEVNSTCDVGFKLAQVAQQVWHVKPHAEIPVGPIVFEPLQHMTYNTTLYVRNNLTMLHPVRLNGIGGSGRLVFPNGSLDFNLTAADLAEEAADDSMASPQRVAISKSFTATNDCELPVEVVRIDINGIPGCSGFGFQIHDCHPFTVPPHENVSLTVSFSPDFPASRWEQRLRLHTQSGILSVPLRAFVPTELLPHLANRAPSLGESEASVKKAITILAILLCGAMFVVVVGDCMKVYRANAPNGDGLIHDSALRPCEMINLLSWPSVNALAPSSMWSSNVRRDHLLGTTRTARRAAREEPQEMGNAQRQEIMDNQHHQQGGRPARPNPQPGSNKGAPHERSNDPRYESEDHKGAQSSNDMSSGHPTPRTILKEEAKLRAAEEAERRLLAEAARAAQEEAEHRAREEERRNVREAVEDAERQVKATVEELRKPQEERRRSNESHAGNSQAQSSAPQPKAEASKGKKKAEKKEQPAAAAAASQAREAPQESEKRRGSGAKKETAEETRPQAREEREKPARQEREKVQREERDRQAREERERQEREKALREERERTLREERERHAREEEEQRQRSAREDRERQAREERERSNREERERPARDERERQTREERDRHAHDDRESAELEWQQREDREKSQREVREKHTNERRGAGAEPTGKGGQKSKGAKHKEAPPGAPSKGGSRAKASEAHRPPPGGGPLPNSVWADPKPSYYPQPQWDQGEAAAAAAALAASGGSGSSSNFDHILSGGYQGRDGSAMMSGNGGNPPKGLQLPPPPSMPPPPAPRVKGGGQPKADAAGHPKQMHHAKQPPLDLQAMAGSSMLDLSQRQMAHGGMPGMPAGMPGMPAMPTMPGMPPVPGVPPTMGFEPAPSRGSLDRMDRSNIPLMAPIGPNPFKTQGPPGMQLGQRPTGTASLLPDQEFIPINTDSPSLERMHMLDHSPFTSSLFSSPFSMFGPPLLHGGESPNGASGS